MKKTCKTQINFEVRFDGPSANRLRLKSVFMGPPKTDYRWTPIGVRFPKTDSDRSPIGVRSQSVVMGPPKTDSDWTPIGLHFCWRYNDGVRSESDRSPIRLELKLDSSLNPSLN